MPISFGFDVPAQQAINYFRAKGLKTSFSYADMVAGEHATMLTVAKMLDTDLLQDVYDSLLQAMVKGESMASWKNRLMPHLQANGWWGKQEVIDPVTGKKVIAQLGSVRRLELIFRTNMQSAYAVGQWQQVQANKAVMPYLMYVAVDDNRTRPEHRALNGKIYPVDHPFWRYYYPPNGFNCFLPDTKINGSLVGGIKSFYEGEAVEITTASGRSLRVTANHPILTNRGWVVAKMINPTDKLVAYDAPIEAIHADSCSRQINNQKLIPTAENLFHSFLSNAFAFTEGSSLKLDNDFLSNYSEVYINVLDSGLMVKFESVQDAGINKELFIPRNDSCATTQHIPVRSSNADFVVSNIVNTQNSINIPLRVAELFGDGSFADVCSSVEPNNLRLKIIVSFLGGFPSCSTLPFDGIRVLFDGLPLDKFSLRTTAQDNTIFSELSSNGCSTDFGLFRYLLDAHAANVFIDPVVNVSKFSFSGHVYDFQSTEGILSANGIITHNCRCIVIQLSQKMLDDMGLSVSNDEDIEWVKWKNPRTGLTEKIPKGIDPGFQFNAGIQRAEQLRQLAREKAQAIKDVELRDAAQNGLALVEKMADGKTDILPPVIKQKADDMNPIRTDWGDFPKVIVNAPIKEANNHALYQQAKGGDIDAALQLAQDVLTQESIDSLVKLAGDKNPILVSVHAEEEISVNHIPLAMSIVIAEKTGWDFDVAIVQSKKVGRTSAPDGFYRIAVTPTFTGNFPSGRAAIILDDTLTQGGTFASMKGHIESQGGVVIGALALTGKQYSATIAVSAETLTSLREKYGQLEEWFKVYFGYGFAKLTESEARYILGSKQNVDAIKNRLIAAREGSSR